MVKLGAFGDLESLKAKAEEEERLKREEVHTKLAAREKEAGIRPSDFESYEEYEQAVKAKKTQEMEKEIGAPFDKMMGALADDHLKKRKISKLQNEITQLQTLLDPLHPEENSPLVTKYRQQISKIQKKIADLENEEPEKVVETSTSPEPPTPTYEFIDETKEEEVVLENKTPLPKKTIKAMSNEKVTKKTIPKLDQEDWDRRGEDVGSYTFTTEKGVPNFILMNNAELVDTDGKVFSIIKTFNNMEGRSSLILKENGSKSKIVVELGKFNYDPTTKESEIETHPLNDSYADTIVFKKKPYVRGKNNKNIETDEQLERIEEQTMVEEENRVAKQEIKEITLTPEQVQIIIEKMKERILRNETEKLGEYEDAKIIPTLKEKFELYNIPFKEIEFMEDTAEELAKEHGVKKIAANKKEVMKILNSHDKEVLMKNSKDKTLSLKTYDYLITQAQNKLDGLSYNKKLSTLIDKITTSNL